MNVTAEMLRLGAEAAVKIMVERGPRRFADENSMAVEIAGAVLKAAALSDVPSAAPQGFLVFRGNGLGRYDLLAVEYVGNAYAPRTDTLYFRALEEKGAIRIGDIVERRPLYQWETMHATLAEAESVAKERRASDLKARAEELKGIESELSRG